MARSTRRKNDAFDGTVDWRNLPLGKPLPERSSPKLPPIDKGPMPTLLEVTEDAFLEESGGNGDEMKLGDDESTRLDTNQTALCEAEGASLRGNNELAPDDGDERFLNQSAHLVVETTFTSVDATSNISARQPVFDQSEDLVDETTLNSFDRSANISASRAMDPKNSLNESTCSSDASRLRVHQKSRVVGPSNETIFSDDSSRLQVYPDAALLAVRTAGPNEEQYKRDHEKYVMDVVSDFQRRHPKKLKDYLSMSSSEKARERERVAALLARVAADKCPSILACKMRHREQPAILNSSSESSATRLNSENPNSSMDLSGADDEVAQHIENDQSSVALLSPEAEIEDLASRVNKSMALLSDDSSVEMVRASRNVLSSPLASYESPVASSRAKRLATTSGKKGADVSRMRMDDDSFVSFDVGGARPSEAIPSPSKLLSQRSLESPAFPASQSPIRDNNSSWDQDSVDFNNRSMNMNDTIQSVDCTVNYRNRVGRNDRSFLREIPANVKLKEGASFRMKPLRVRCPGGQRRRGASPHQSRSSYFSFPDPLTSYRGALGKQMLEVYDWMEERDLMSTQGDTMGGVVFSMSDKQIIDVSIRLFVLNPSDHVDAQSVDDDVLTGGTLIVTRNKEDLDNWQNALREGTAYSVLNHATMTLSERKRASTANTCCAHDVILTTFDAIKSRDIALPLNEDGHVVMDKIGWADGWYSARSGSGSDAPQRCEELSVLHQVTWRRILFLDVLGRKSYLAKKGTARAVASAALNGNSRFVFFSNSEDIKNPLKALQKSDRTAFRSVGDVLHLPEDQAEQRISGDAMIDLRYCLPTAA